MTPWLRLTIGACIAAGGVCAATVWLATRPIALPDALRVRVPSVIITPAERRTPAPDSAVAFALDRDPFAADRHRPAVRYQLPEEIAAAAALPAAPSGMPHLLGTVVSPGGGSSFAMCQVGTDPPKVVRVGSTVNGLKLERVTQGGALFVSPSGSRIELSVSKTSGS